MQEVRPKLAFVINLDSDVDRYDTFRKKIANVGSVSHERVSGVSGDGIPDIIRFIVTGDEKWSKKKGTIGCFLSHVKAWERVISLSGESAIIVEDDADPSELNHLDKVVFAPDADIIFINDRMALDSRTAEGYECLPVGNLLAKKNLDLVLKRGVGADGYILTLSGAVKLINAIKSDLCYGHVDWRVLRYCVTAQEISALNHTVFLDVVTKHHNMRRPPAWGILNAYSLTRPLIHYGVSAPSRRGQIDRL